MHIKYKNLRYFKGDFNSKQHLDSKSCNTVYKDEYKIIEPKDLLKNMDEAIMCTDIKEMGEFERKVKRC